MPNAVIKLLDSPAPLSRDSILQGLSAVPFVQHQYRWLVSNLASLPSVEASTMLAGYCGLRRMTPSREQRLAEACRLISSMSPAQLASLPERISPSPSFSPPTPAVPTLKPSRGILPQSPKGTGKCP